MSKQNNSSPELFNVKQLVADVLAHKYIFIASFLICISAAFLINKFSPVIYQVSSMIGPIESSPTTLLGTEDLFSGMGTISHARNIENDINSLRSFSLVSETINKLNLEVGYFKEIYNVVTQVHQTYKDSPFIVTLDKSHNQAINIKFYVDVLDETSYRLWVESENLILYNYLDNKIVGNSRDFKIDTICRFNETVTYNNFKFSISLNEEVLANNIPNIDQYYFELYHLDYLSKKYLGGLRVGTVSSRSSLMSISFRGENLELVIDFLNRYLETYVDDNLAKKNKIALNTVNFIDSQLSEMADSLVISESQLRDFRSANQVTDLSYQGQRALEQMTQIENELSTLQVQERYYNYVIDYFDKNQDMASLAPPSVANVADPIMNALILELLDLNAERSTILSNNAEKNLFLGQIENKIRLQKQAIIENVTNNLNTLTLSKNELNYRENKLSKEISRLPRTELNMVSMQRQFDLSDAIYTFLLQKRSEAAITMASNYPDFEILEPARDISKSILSPRIRINYLLSIFLGLVIPTIFIILKDFLNEKISKVRDVEILLGRPVLSLIFQNSYKTEAVVPEFPGSYISESFRILRTNLFMKLRSEPERLIMVTSAQPQDGKSFISFNLAASIASVGFKTIILDCDLRRPTLHEKFKIDSQVGISTFMANKTPIKEIMIKSDIENLFFIPAGPILPNSSEMIEAGILDDLINKLKVEFDYVIIDTTPSGLVADASMFVKYASTMLLVCRNNYTRRDVFSDLLDQFQLNEISKFDVVYNDLNIKKSSYGRYNAYYRKS